MAAVMLGSFGGMSEKLSARLLPETMSQFARNVTFDSGSLRPLKEASTVSGVTFALGGVDASTKTIFKTANGTWLEFSADVDVMNSPIAQDQHNRVYVTNNGALPQIFATTATNNLFQLGISPPSTPTVALSPASSANTASETPTSRAYVCTYVTAFGEEGPPSTVLVSDIKDVYTDQTVTVTVGSPSDANSNVAKARVYRTDENGIYRYVMDVASANYGSAVTDSVTDAQLGEELPSSDWTKPPAAMKGLVALPNGICAGFTGQTLLFSEAFMPHAWPEAYQLTCRYNIVAIAPLETGLLVLTEGKPSIVQGSDPAGMTMTELDVSQACVSKRSVVDMGDSVIYASPDGLVRISGQGAALITEGVYSKDQWQAAHSPSTIRAFRWEDRYVGFHDYSGSAAATTKGFIVDPRGGQNAFSVHTQDGVAGFNSLLDDKLYFADASGNFKTFATAATYNTGVWRSKEFFTPRPVNLGAALVNFGQDLGGSNSSIILRRGDGEVDEGDYHTETIAASTDHKVFRLPSGTKRNTHEVEVQTQRELLTVAFAESPRELT